ncbi:cystathionine gamma-synthase family protein [Fulvivirga lutea]|uniref:Cystathionine gamma-synthase family protein n=2 Tax=Fulvivirga lutea TaxID=2810512 RepID=A0A974WG76_9BACT|nr:cystathionine gamma-synthase family protein [Fulvivirga lutea]QSE97919.1 cystathionine gamma-synthase family protein [Fulvivirga lutea]
MSKKMSPESLMMSYGYKPSLSEGAIKSPIFQTSTFAFESAEAGKAFFEVAYGLREKNEGEELGLIYSRLNNPDLEILENRLTLWDEAEDAAVFESGMSAITTALLQFLSPGDLILHSNPIYGGTDHFIKHVLPRFQINVIGFDPLESEEDIIQKIEASGCADRLKMVYVETPANPTNHLIDLELCRRVADYFSKEEKALVVVDNTYMGPIWQHPLKFGADLVIYSATKYIGGHSDVIAGACLGSKEHIAKIKEMRTFLGNMAGPWTGWLLLRSLETLKIRMEKQAENAAYVFNVIKDHPKVERIGYLGAIKEGTPQYEIFKKQYTSAGAMLSIILKGGEKEAFKFLNSLKLIKLAVSLGSTESLAQHPASMTHAGVDHDEKIKFGIKDSLVRLSVGVENPADLVWDIEQALEHIE